MTRLALVCALTLLAQSAQLRLKDGRVLHGQSVSRGGKTAVLRTVFGSLRVPVQELAGDRTAERKPAPETTRTRKTRWLEIEHDLSEKREKLYADQLDAFFDWMIRVYELNPKRLKPPYRMRVFRRRADFKKLQAEIAPGMEQKGKAFAEGVAGFYSPGHDRIFMWDVEGGRGGIHLEVAKHETTHLVNKLMAEQKAIRIPTWFEEGSATYFSMSLAIPGKELAEPDDHPGALARVVGEIERGKPYTGRELRTVTWAKFLGRQYSWGWGLVRFFRQHRQGRRWPALLKYLRTVSGGPETASEERRFLETAGFKSSEAFDREWHAHLLAAKPAGRRAPIGTSPEALARVAKIKRPPAGLARHFARIGISLARSRESVPAIVYLRAALRGGVEDPDAAYQLAIALAERDDLVRDEPWPQESLDALEDAVALEPLRALYRLELGRQLLLRSKVQEAHLTLGLALILVGPDDDDADVAMWLLRAAAARAQGRKPEALAEALAAAVPSARGALRAALVYTLQADEDWDELAALLERRHKRRTATLEERAMLARLYRLGDRLDEAAALLAACLEEDPDALHLWPDLVDCLAGEGRIAEAVAARERAYEALDGDPRSLGWIRRRLERIPIG